MYRKQNEVVYRATLQILQDSVYAYVRIVAIVVVVVVVVVKPEPDIMIMTKYRRM